MVSLSLLLNTRLREVSHESRLDAWKDAGILAYIYTCFVIKNISVLKLCFLIFISGCESSSRSGNPHMKLYLLTALSFYVPSFLPPSNNERLCGAHLCGAHLCGAQLRCHESNKAVQGQDRTGQDRTGQDRTGQHRRGQDRTRQEKPGEVCMDVCIEMDGLVYVGRGESDTDVVMST